MTGSNVTNPILLYGFEYYLNGNKYGGEISAQSHEQVLNLVPTAINIGLINEFVCKDCGSIDVKENEVWAEVIG